LWKALSSGKKFILISGPCVIESEALCLKIGSSLKKICDRLGILYVFKASYDKANRTSGQSFRGPGIEEGLATLRRIGDKLGVPVLTDVHTEEQARLAGNMIDILQIPAFLCRQTDLIQAAVETGRVVNVKKGQFLSPKEMGQVVKKAGEFGGNKLLLTERGTTFGYNNLVADMRSLYWMRELGYRVVMDATHSVQRPGGLGTATGGDGKLAPVLARAAVATGCDGVFMETHPDPANAFSDGPNQIPLSQIAEVVETLRKIHGLVRDIT
jgi:2-dehydro-3-deoxyphosphooctonate aldolase (KDO 8-P synthase)